MKKNGKQRTSLGALIAALTEEAGKVTRNRWEKNVLVYAALRDLLRNQRTHLMALKA